jgi:anti-sigma factor RsiW
MTERLSDLLQTALAGVAADACPDADTLLAFTDGALGEDARTRVAAHIGQCAGCAAAVRVALAVEDWSKDVAVALAPVQANSNVHTLVPRTRPRSWAPFALAASLMLAVTLGVLLRPHAPDDTLRGSTAIDSMPRAGELLAQAPERISWPCADAPDPTRLELLGTDATTLWTGAATGCAVQLPADLRARLAPGEYQWRVRDAAGTPVLGPIAFRIEP